MHVPVNVYADIYVEKLEVNVTHSPLYFLKQVLSLNLELNKFLDWMTNELLEFSKLHLTLLFPPGVGLQILAALRWVLGIALRSSCLPQAL